MPHKKIERTLKVLLTEFDCWKLYVVNQRLLVEILPF